MPDEVKKHHWIRFRLICMKDAIVSFFKFIKRLPGYLWLNRFYDCEPDFYPWVMHQYSTVMSDLTGGKLSKASHPAETVLEEVWARMDYLYSVPFIDEEEKE